jgi:hypothetical protein
MKYPGINPARAIFRNPDIQYAFDRMNPMAGRELREMRAKMAGEHYKTAIEGPMAASPGNGCFTQVSPEALDPSSEL